MHCDARPTGPARAPLLPALIFTIVVTQLPFVVTLVISFMNWNAYYPDDRGFAGLDQLQAGADRRHDMRNAIFVTIAAHRRRWCWSAWCSAC